ncbi:hypothetical protein B0H15DRAFT_957435 [Mycena belliarum]|uniref:S-adenosyl-L-methionine-dependent methyltransferase n=1 Tax=Mycena belliarum TaxID=1033014 RepID=A0AAD6TNN4_9AGAR|nr:hypothetical protein B0H15DRAFT_957435 [Mycena belliae]
MAAPATRYAIPATAPEKDRLAHQYTMMKHVYGWAAPVPATIDLAQVHAVLDIAAGTCVWALDVACAPQISARRGSVSIYACDINRAILPPEDVTDAAGITTFEQDVTQPFACEYHAKFDLVHMRFLTLCLTPEGWRAALANIHTLLAPGGQVLLDEVDLILFKEGQYSAGSSYDLDKYTGGPSWIDKANCMYTSIALRNDFVLGSSFRLGPMLERAGFTVAETEVAPTPIGKLCRKVAGLRGDSIAAYEALSADNFIFVLREFATRTLRGGRLEVQRGTRIVEKEALEAVLEEVRQGVRTEGAVVMCAYFVARKQEMGPFGSGS